MCVILFVLSAKYMYTPQLVLCKYNVRFASLVTLRLFNFDDGAVGAGSAFAAGIRSIQTKEDERTDRHGWVDRWIDSMDGWIHHRFTLNSHAHVSTTRVDEESAGMAWIHGEKSGTHSFLPSFIFLIL